MKIGKYITVNSNIQWVFDSVIVTQVTCSYFSNNYKLCMITCNYPLTKHPS